MQKSVCVSTFENHPAISSYIKGLKSNPNRSDSVSALRAVIEMLTGGELPSYLKRDKPGPKKRCALLEARA